MTHIVSANLPKTLLNYDTVHAIQDSGVKAAIDPKMVVQAYVALIDLLKKVGEPGITLEAGITHRLMQQVQALLGSGVLDVDQTKMLHETMRASKDVLAKDTLFAEPVQGFAAGILGSGTPNRTPMAAEASITEKLLEYTTTKISDVSESLSTPVERGVNALKKMKSANILRRMFEGLKKLFQGKNYKTYPVRTLEKDLRAYLTRNEKDLGAISVTVSLDTFGTMVAGMVERSFPDADAKWIDDALETTGNVVREYWDRAHGQFLEDSKQYRIECRHKAAAIMGRGRETMPDEVTPKAMQHMQALQEELSTFWEGIDLTRLTAADLCGAMEDHRIAQGMIQGHKDNLVKLIQQAKEKGDEILGEVHGLALMTHPNVLAPGELQKITADLEALAEKAVHMHAGLALIPTLNEQVGQAIADAHQDLDARCDKEITHAQAWYSETEERLAHTIKKRATQSKNLTRLMQQAPLIAMDAAHLRPMHPMSQNMLSLYEHCQAIVGHHTSVI